MRFNKFSPLKIISSMEVIWAILAIISLILGIRGTYTDGLQESYPLFIITLIAAAMYFIRKRMRKKQEEENQS